MGSSHRTRDAKRGAKGRWLKGAHPQSPSFLQWRSAELAANWATVTTGQRGSNAWASWRSAVTKLVSSDSARAIYQPSYTVTLLRKSHTHGRETARRGTGSSALP